MTSNSSDPWSPQYGTATYTSFSDTQTPLSPSRYSYTSRSDSQRPSSDGDDNGSAHQMRRITVSPAPSQQNSDSDAYTDDNSIDEVEATLNDLDNEFDDTEQALSQWSHGSSSGPSYTSATGSYTGTYTGTGYTGSPSYVSLPTLSLRPTSTPPVDPRARLSKITERTEESSRPNSGAFGVTGAARPANPTPEAFRRSLFLGGTPSSHSRSSTDPGSDRTLPPPGRATELIAVFETNSPGGGHSRTTSAPGVRPPSPFYSSTGYGYGSRPSSPSKSSASYTATDTRPTGSSFLSPPPRPWTSMSGDGTFRSTSPGGTWSRGTGSYTTPGTYTTQTPSTYGRTLTHTETDNRTYTGTDTRTYTGTDTRTYTGTDTNTFTDTFTRTGTNTATSMTPTSTLRRPQTSPRSPLASVRNIVALWKERTPTMSRSPGKSPDHGSATSVSPPPDGEGLFGIRRRAQRASAQLQLRDNGQGSDPVTPTRRGDVDAASIRSARSGHLPPGLDVADLLPYTQSDEAPLHIGLLWYLNVHDAPPYRWQRCQALLYPQLLLLSWLSPGGGRGIVALDLLNCTSVQSAPSPTHPSARDDIGTIAARSQSVERDGQPLMDMLVPFHMLYADGVERLAAESLLERQKWVNRLWEAVNRPMAMPDSSSVTRSPTGSIRTILSIDSRASTSSTGSRSTVYVPPLRSLPSIPDFSSNFSSASSRSDGLSRRTSIVSSHHTRTVDDTVISNQQYVYPGDPRAIQPARTGSLLRRSGSMTDLDAEFQSALTRARGARPGLGFANLVFGGGAPVTISSGPTLGRDIVVTPPPSTGRGSDRARSEVSDEQFFTAGSSEGSRSSYFSQTSYSSELRTSTGLRTDGTSFFDSSAAGTRTLPSTTSYTRTDSTSYLGDSQTSMSYTGTSPSRTPLSRTREVRRRGGRSSSRSYSSGYITDASSDKENLSGSYTPESGTQSLDSRSQGSGSYTSGTRSYTSGSRSYTDSGSYTPSGGFSKSGSYTPSGSSTASGVYSSSDMLTPGNSSETGYDICTSSDATYSGFPVTSSEETITPSTLSPQSVPASDLDSENFVTASQGSSDYLTARSPSLRGSIAESETSFASFPTIPSESEYKTADTGYSHYRTVSEPSLGSDYITAELCPTIPSEQNTPTLSSVKLDSEEDTRSVLGLPSLPPSEIPSIRSPSMFSEDVLPPLPPSESSSPPSIHLTPSPSPPLPPLPPSLPSLSPPPSPLTPTEESLDIATPTSYRSPSQVSLPRSPSSEASSSLPPLSATISSSASDATPSSLVLSSSPAPSEHPSTPAPRLSSISSPTISSVSSLSDLTPAFSDFPPASPEPWAHETDDSYESSQLAPSPSVISLAVPEGIDNSFETSFLRPSGSGVSSVDRLSPIPETPTSLSTMLPRSPFPQLTPVPMPPSSISSSSGVPTPSSLSAGVVQRSPLPALSPLLSLSLSAVSSSDVDTPSSIDVTTPGTFSLSRSSFPTLSAVSSLTPSILSSADVRTPSDISFSDDQHPQLARSRSTASVASFRSQSSLNSSVFDARSLMDEEDLESVDEPSTVPSLLTTPSQADRELHSPFSMTDGQLRTPEPPSMNVSLSTPRGSAQTIQSSLRTQTSESAPTERDLSRDIDRIADDLRRYDDARGSENRDLGDNIRALRDELQDLSEYLHRTPSPRARPSQPLVDQMIGGSSPVSSLLPGDRRDMSVTSGQLSRATSSASSIGSYLSSHHSDDEYLASESYHDSPPPWHAPTISDSDDSSSIFSDSQLGHSPSYPDSSESSGQPFPPPSPSPSSTSTIRGRPILTPPDLSGPLEAVREQLNALWEGQVSTNHMLDRLVGDRTPQPQDNVELRDRLLRIEDLLQGLSNQPPREPHIIYEPYPPAPLSSIGSDISLQQLADQLRGFETDQDIPAPVPIREGPSLVERLEGILAAGINQPAPPIQPPPDFISLVFNRRERRSVSPISVQTLPPRPESEPPFPQVYTRPVRNVPPRRAPRAPLRQAATEQPTPAPPTPAPPPPVPPPQSGAVHPETDPNFEQALRNMRMERFPGTDGTFTTGRRPAAGPPPAPVFSLFKPLGDRRARTAPPEPWYRPAPARQEHSGAPPQAPPPAPSQPSQSQRTRLGYMPMPPGPVIVQLPPVFDGMMDLLRENRDAQSASVEQQRELMRYMRSLNDWLARDTSDRQDEIRGLNARVDQLRQDILNIRVDVLPGESDRSSSTRSDGTSTPSPRGPARPPPFGRPMPMPMPEPRIQMPQPQHQGPVIPQLPDGQFPPGFVPYPAHLQPPREGPVIPPVIPEMFPGRRPHRSETPPFTPVIPNLPPSGPGLGPAPPPPMDGYRPGPMPGMPYRPSSVEPVVPFIPPDLTGRSGSPRIVPPRYPEPRIIEYPGSPSSSSTTSSSRSISRDERDRHGRSSGPSRRSSRRSSDHRRPRSRTSSSRSSRSSTPHQIIVQAPPQQGMQYHPEPAHPAQAPAPAVVVVPTQQSDGRSHYEHPAQQPPAPIIINQPATPYPQTPGMPMGSAMLPGPMMPPMVPPMMPPTEVHMPPMMKEGVVRQVGPVVAVVPVAIVVVVIVEAGARVGATTIGVQIHRDKHNPPHLQLSSFSPLDVPVLAHVPIRHIMLLHLCRYYHLEESPSAWAHKRECLGSLSLSSLKTAEAGVAAVVTIAVVGVRAADATRLLYKLPPVQQPGTVMMPPGMVPSGMGMMPSNMGMMPMMPGGPAMVVQSRSRSSSRSRSPRGGAPAVIVQQPGAQADPGRGRSRSRSHHRRSRSPRQGPQFIAQPVPTQAGVTGDPPGLIHRAMTDGITRVTIVDNILGLLQVQVVTLQDALAAIIVEIPIHGPEPPPQTTVAILGRDILVHDLGVTRRLTVVEDLVMEAESAPFGQRTDRDLGVTHRLTAEEDLVNARVEGQGLAAIPRHAVPDLSPHLAIDVVIVAATRVLSPTGDIVLIVLVVIRVFEQSPSRGGRSGSSTPTHHVPPRHLSRPGTHGSRHGGGSANIPIEVITPTTAGSHHTRPPTILPMDEMHRIPSVGRDSSRRGRSQSGPHEPFRHSRYHDEDELDDQLGVHRVPSTRRPGDYPSDSRVHTPAPTIPVLPSHAPTHATEGRRRDSDEIRPLPVPTHPHTPGRRSPSLRSARRYSPSARSRHDTITPLPGDLSDAERERDRAHRLQEVEGRLHEAAHSILEADEQREHDYRRNEEDRERVFQEGEERRHREARERAELVWEEFHSRLAALPAPPLAPEHPVDVGGDDVSVHSRESAAQQAASQHAIEILDTVKAERDEFARERENAAREREILMEQAAMEREQLAEQQEQRIKALEDELSAVRAELENEKQQRVMIETEQRERDSEALLERDEAVRNQLGDITNLVQDQRDACERKKELMDVRWEEKQGRRGEKDQKMNDLEALVRKLSQDMEETRDLALEAKVSRERGPDLQDVIKTLQEQNAAQQAMLNELSQSWRDDCARYHQETIESVQSTANQQVHFNYLDEFSKALASEVRMLLGEVGKLREERRGLQHELGYLLCMKSKYGPGGEFEPDWKPAPGTPGGPPMDPPQPPEEPPAPEIPPPAKPGWRKVTPRTPRIRKPKKEAAPAPQPQPPQPPQPGPSSHSHMMYRGPDPRTSWNAWIPDPNNRPSESSTPLPAPHLLVPEPQDRSPGLFGPRSPASSIHRG
ncbi:hypothetical protein FPV67DRAFT_1654875 [Lyophyllum atratum]|nr:hypothetical protein FPV67DRAFT_1654875 [Lyophyllum atratum]